MVLKYTAKHTTDFLEVVFKFTGLLQLVNRLQQTCQFQKVAKSPLKSDLLQLVETTCSKPVDNKFRQSTCNKSVDNLQQTCQQSARKASERILISAYW